VDRKSLNDQGHTRRELTASTLNFEGMLLQQFTGPGGLPAMHGNSITPSQVPGKGRAISQGGQPWS
jgi:hypothetical protein